MFNTRQSNKERMIVFVAPYPRISDEKDGFIQRIASIDLLAQGNGRIYLDISFRKFWFTRAHLFGEVKVFQVNAIRHFFFIVDCFRKASVVYVHSVYSALPALAAYWLGKPITDLHGVVPEELLFQGKGWKSRLLGVVEHIVVRRSAILIHVTDAMKSHFLNKYGRNITADCVIPIMPSLSDAQGARDNVFEHHRDLNAVIYAGGLQVWQNIQMMLVSAREMSHLDFIFLTSAVDELRELAEQKKLRKFVCLSVPVHEVQNYYLTCAFGFILRDPLLVNEVACPTKLVEYLYWGVIPIVLTPKIGDFQKMGFTFISLQDFNLGLLPDKDEIARMRRVNRQVVENLFKNSGEERNRLSEILCATQNKLL